MKTKFEISNEVFGSIKTLEECYKIYEEYYKKEGFILDKEREEVYMIFDEQFDFSEGDRINILGMNRIIEWKSTDITNKIISYLLVEE